VALSLALAHWDALDYEPALTLYTQAIRRNLQSASVRDIEQYANLLSRAAVQGWRDGKVDLKRSIEQVEEARRWLLWLNDKRGGGPSAERLSLLASVNKRLAFMSDSPATALPHVQAMIARYAEAAELSQRSGLKLASYPILNGLFGHLVAQWLSARARQRSARGTVAADRKRLADVRVGAAAGTEFEFWSEAARIDSDLLEALWNDADNSWSGLPDAYGALRRLSSRLEFGAILDHLKFMQRMATLAERETEGARLQTLLDTLVPAPVTPSVPASATGNRVRRRRPAARRPK
jgi:hypothetical protein